MKNALKAGLIVGLASGGLAVFGGLAGPFVLGMDLGGQWPFVGMWERLLMLAPLAALFALLAPIAAGAWAVVREDSRAQYGDKGLAAAGLGAPAAVLASLLGQAGMLAAALMTDVIYGLPFDQYYQSNPAGAVGTMLVQSIQGAAAGVMAWWWRSRRAVKAATPVVAPILALPLVFSTRSVALISVSPVQLRAPAGPPAPFTSRPSANGTADPGSR